jgi:hypothetical protein
MKKDSTLQISTNTTTVIYTHIYIYIYTYTYKDNALAYIAPCKRQRSYLSPFLHLRIILFDGGKLGRAVAATDGIHFPFNYSDVKTTTGFLHRGQGVPHISFWVIQLHTLQTLGPVVTACNINEVQTNASDIINPLNAELNPICHLLVLLGDLTFMGPCIISIFQYTCISNKMQRYTVYLYLETALHVSSGTSTHHQERIQLYLQHLAFVTPLLLSAAIVEELEPV